MSRRSLCRNGLAGLALAIALITTACSGAVTAAPQASPTPRTGLAAAGAEVAPLQAILDDWRSEADTFGVTVSIRVPGHGDIHLASGVDDRAITAYRPDRS